MAAGRCFGVGTPTSCGYAVYMHEVSIVLKLITFVSLFLSPLLPYLLPSPPPSLSPRTPPVRFSPGQWNRYSADPSDRCE